MPVKRRRPKAREHRITPEAIAAFEAGDYFRLHCALNLAPYQPSPLPESINGLGVDPENPPTWRNLFTESWPLAVELQRELIAAGAKMPTKAARTEGEE